MIITSTGVIVYWQLPAAFTMRMYSMNAKNSFKRRGHGRKKKTRKKTLSIGRTAVLPFLNRK